MIAPKADAQNFIQFDLDCNGAQEVMRTHLDQAEELFGNVRLRSV